LKKKERGRGDLARLLRASVVRLQKLRAAYGQVVESMRKSRMLFRSLHLNDTCARTG
jgi:hypothetical protein